MTERSSTVWMVHALTGRSGVKGTLSLLGGRLEFRPSAASSGETVFPLSNVRRTRRVIGSPILEIRLAAGERPGIVGFYFVEPPELADRATMGFRQRRSTRKTAVVALRRGNLEKKREVAEWVEAIRQAKTG